jgi:gluconolactonase
MDLRTHVQTQPPSDDAAPGSTLPHAAVLANGLGFTEGPTIMRDGRVVVVSMSHGRVYAVGVDGAVSVLTETDAAPNGATEGADGAIYVAHTVNLPPAKQPTSPTTGGVLRIDPSGETSWVTRDLISPNDLCFGPDGYLYVTDPTRPRRQDGRLWRVDVETGKSELLLSVAWHPNGIGFSPDDKRLYVASTHDYEIVVFDFSDGKLGEPRIWARLPEGRPDGFAVDVEGNVLVAAPSNSPNVQSYVHVFDHDGNHVDRYAPAGSNRLSNCALGTDSTLYVTDIEHGQVLVAHDWPTKGVPLHPFR